MMATARQRSNDKVIGWIRADDYSPSPSGMMEMVSACGALSRRASPETDAPQLRGRALTMGRAKPHRHRDCARAVALTRKEYELLRLFLRNPGRAFTRESLLCAVWGDEFLGETRTVDVHVGTLRTKLGESGSRIETVRGVGYRLEAGL